MKYSNYKKGSSALRHILNNENIEYSGHFASFMFNLRDSSRGRSIRGIYNAKTNNVIAFINTRGNIFMRPNSVYFDKIESGSKKVIKNERLREIRNKVPSRAKGNARYNILAEQAVDKFIKNKDKPNRVYLFSIKQGEGTDVHFIQRRIRELFMERRLEKRFPNTTYGLNMENFTVEETMEAFKLYWEVQDYEKVIAKEQHEKMIKYEVAKAFIDNVREIAQESITNHSTLNPLQFTHTIGDEKVVGTLNLSRMDMSYPVEMPIRDWLNEDYLVRYISFHEALGTLESRGIDEMSSEERRSIHQRMYDYARNTVVNPGGIYSYNDASVWHVNEPTEYVTAADSAFGTSVVAPTPTRVDLQEAVDNMPDFNVTTQDVAASTDMW